MRVLVRIRNKYEGIQLRNRRNSSASPGNRAGSRIIISPFLEQKSYQVNLALSDPGFLDVSRITFGAVPLDILASNINMIGFNAMPFLKLFHELAPFLLGRNVSEDMYANHSDAFVQLANDARSRIREVTPEELTKFKQLPLIVDVRERDEFIKGHISGAKHISRGVLEQKVFEIAPDCASPILVYCAGGNRGALAADNLQKMGYQNVFSLKGGLSGWLEAGGLVETTKTL